MISEEKIIPNFSKNYGIFLSLLFLYLFVICYLSKSYFHGDEWRYVYFAKNLLHGFYSPSGIENAKLWNGPGYPIVLVPFAAMKLPWITAKFANAFFLFGAVIFFYKTLCLSIKRNKARYFAVFFGMYFPFMSNLHFLNTETLTVFLATVFSFCFCRQAIHKKMFNSYFFMAGFVLAWLMLTKIIFGYVVLFMIAFSFVYYILLKEFSAKKCFLICCFAMLLCFPYLLYTYSLTGKIFYWGNSGGLNLYWMSSPYPNEFGDCYQLKEVREIKPLAKNHGDFFEKIEGLNLIEKDNALRTQALINIMEYP